MLPCATVRCGATPAVGTAGAAAGPGGGSLCTALAQHLRALRDSAAVVAIIGAGASTAAPACLPDYRTGGLLQLGGLAAAAAASAPPPPRPPSARLGLRRPRPPAAAEFTTAAEAQELFDAAVFAREPELFYTCAPALLARLRAARPTRAHAWLAALSARGTLVRAYSQNVDGLEVAAGVMPAALVACHGTLASATCARCGRRTRTDAPAFVAALDGGGVVTCRAAGGRCASAVMQPDVVFYRTPLPAAFSTAAAADCAPGSAVDAVIVLGTSLQVAPVATLPARLPHAALRVLINRERLAPLGKAPPLAFDLELLGDADVTCALLLAELEGEGAAEAAALAAGAAGEVAHMHLHHACLELAEEENASGDPRALLCRVALASECRAESFSTAR